MSSTTLKAFLNPINLDETQEVIVSDRFVGEDGKPVPFVIKAIPQAVNDKLVTVSTHNTRDTKNHLVEKLNRTEYQNRIVVACTVEPDFNAMEMLQAHNAGEAIDVPGKMLLPGEFAKLVSAIMDINHFTDDVDDDELKNS